MIIKILLISCFILFGIYLMFVANSANIRAWRKIAIFLLGAFAIFSILFPEITTNAADWLGVGRGADLLFYLTTVAVIYLGLHSYIRYRQIENRMVILVRKLALIEANQQLSIKEPTIGPKDSNTKNLPI